jgi:hypothetical protein
MIDKVPVTNTFDDGWENNSGAAGSDYELPVATAATSSGEPGPCLFLGPAGQRCNRRALDDGFCALHRPGGIAKIITAPGRVLAAVVTIVVLLWPYIADMVREIIRWMATH